MKLSIERQESYSRGQLLLRTFFGAIYIALPHVFILYFIMIASAFLNFLTFWVIMFTGKHPRSWWDFQMNFQRWNLRLNASLLNLRDEYPPFGLSAQMPGVTLEAEYPESNSRGSVLLRTLFGFFYVLLPHAFILMFRGIACYFIIFIAFWAVLFTGKYPEGMFKFVVDTIRWSTRVNFFMMYMNDEYPPFSGAENP